MKIVLTETVCGDFPFHETQAPAGSYEAHCDRYGAVSVEATNGRLLGIKPHEYCCPELEQEGWRKDEEGLWHPPSGIAWSLLVAWKASLDAVTKSVRDSALGAPS